LAAEKYAWKKCPTYLAAGWHKMSSWRRRCPRMGMGMGMWPLRGQLGSRSEPRKKAAQRRKRKVSWIEFFGTAEAAKWDPKKKEKQSTDEASNTLVKSNYFKLFTGPHFLSLILTGNFLL